RSCSRLRSTRPPSRRIKPAASCAACRVAARCRASEWPATAYRPERNKRGGAGTAWPPANLAPSQGGASASMYVGGSSYEEVARTFRWEVPGKFNIGRAICEMHAERTPDAPALIYEQADGRTRTWTFREVGAAAARCANVLAAFGVGPGTVVAIHL